jgi:hypothetical protein
MHITLRSRVTKYSLSHPHLVQWKSLLYLKHQFQRSSCVNLLQKDPYLFEYSTRHPCDTLQFRELGISAPHPVRPSWSRNPNQHIHPTGLPTARRPQTLDPLRKSLEPGSIHGPSLCASSCSISPRRQRNSRPHESRHPHPPTSLPHPA